jgi:adenine/guanine phosphoribosyltransferase-like PRPP-binding protein
MSTKLMAADLVDRSGWFNTPPLDVSEWWNVSQPNYTITIGGSPVKADGPTGGTTAAPVATGGTYSTSKLDHDTGDTILRTWNYDQTLTEQPISEERKPMVQMDTVRPSTSKYQMPGARVMNFTETYMEEGHDHGLLLSSWKDLVGKTKVDTLVGTGVSGTIAVVNLARDLGIHYLIIRKPGVNTHSSWPAEGHLGKNWAFVDDLVSSGATIQRVWDAMNSIQESGFSTQFKGVFLYANGNPRWVAPGKGRYDKSRLHEWLAGAESYKSEFGRGRGESAW